MIKVSVIMSVYNTKEEWLKQAIESILNQTFKDFEFIIILDSPTDNSEFIVNNYAQKDNRIIVIKNKKNLGLTKSLNIGIKKSKGEYIARMDSDDIADITRFEKQVNFLNCNKDVAVVGSYVCMFDEENNYTIGMNNNSNNNEINKVRMIFCNAGIAHSTAMIRRNFLESYNIYYDETIKKAQDYALWSEIILNDGKIECIDEVLLKYRVHSGQITQQCSEEQINCIKKIMKKQIKYYFDFAPTNEELDINFNFFRNYNLINKKDTEKYLLKLITKNKKIDKSLIKKEICSIWLYDLIARIIKNRDFSLLFSKMTLKSLRYINYVFEKRKSDKLYKNKVKEYCTKQN